LPPEWRAVAPFATIDRYSGVNPNARSKRLT
jgi:hypothetical protein